MGLVMISSFTCCFCVGMSVGIPSALCKVHTTLTSIVSHDIRDSINTLKPWRVNPIHCVLVMGHSVFSLSSKAMASLLSLCPVVLASQPSVSPTLPPLLAFPTAIHFNVPRFIILIKHCTPLVGKLFPSVSSASWRVNVARRHLSFSNTLRASFKWRNVVIMWH